MNGDEGTKAEWGLIQDAVRRQEFAFEDGIRKSCQVRK